MRALFVIPAALLIFSCMSRNKITPPVELPVVSNYDSLKSYKGREILAEGTVVEKKFVNKGGKETNITEIWLEMNGQNLVMLRQKAEVKAKDFVDKRVKVQGVLFHGNIDSDDPKAQSRYGYRLDYTNIAAN